mgnify:FL=1
MLILMAILFFLMSRRIKGLFDLKFIRAVTRMVVAAVIMGVVTYIMVQLMPFNANTGYLVNVLRFGSIAAVSGIFYFALSVAFKLHEVDPIIGRMKKILFYKAR